MKEMIGPDCGVTVLGRSGLRYREGTKTMFVDGEMLVGPFDFAIYVSSIGIWDGSTDPVTADEQKRIAANIQATFRQNGLNADLR